MAVFAAAHGGPRGGAERDGQLRGHTPYVQLGPLALQPPAHRILSWLLVSLPVLGQHSHQQTE